ncbi:hypothetical protein AMAG_00488 [Allomyces macrogynus ATCC 38327]|uniref:Uncharacterized protein n=1 Tax=Allomyces macrogynus (strain ATCC 38327) TaxID=578462 RepID=A0A0L0RW35_ALLM3|nr:hypothetical protein AMAG_00488 [Allomyces macrogynus ATCC 38327]|eukprot:KNE54518.1 hypothetical protein AMAG_00488 [Allomyces macrogynus ATCC 38327]
MVVLTHGLFDFMLQVKELVFDIHLQVWGKHTAGNLVIDHYNAFHRFVAKHLSRTIAAEDVTLYLKYVKEIICCGHNMEYLYMLKLVQGLLTMGKANGVMLLLQGLEGSRKGMFYSLLKDFIIGKECCIEINNIGKFIWGDFNVIYTNLVDLDLSHVDLTELPHKEDWEAIVKLYAMYHKYVMQRFPCAEPKTMKGFGMAMGKAVYHGADGKEALLFGNVHCNVNGHRPHVYVYKGPVLLAMEDDDE